MTYALETAKPGARIEYFVTIEGIGWPALGLSGALTSGFGGIVWATNDINGDLASMLGCTVYHGLHLPGSISESIEPRTAEYKPGGLSFSIDDHDDWWLANLTPRKVGAETTISSLLGIHKFSETMRLANGTAFAGGQGVWVGGRELVTLGTKSLVGGTEYEYAGCVRGVYGTHVGSVLRRPDDYAFGFWPVGTSIATVSRWWWNRQVALWAHVPGESASVGCQLLWYGRLRSIKNPSAGITWDIECTGDFMSTASRIIKPVDWTCVSNACEGKFEDAYWNPQYGADVESSSWGARRIIKFFPPPTTAFGYSPSGHYELAAAYQYRCEPGGTVGMVQGWLPGGTLQALDIDYDTDVLRSFVLINDCAYFMHCRDDYHGNSDKSEVLADMIPRAGADIMASMTAADGVHVGGDLSIASGSRARFLLSNYGDNRGDSRFCINGHPTRNVVDTLLIFMLSSDREFLRYNAVAGSTSSVVHVASTDAANDALIGKALFCMEGAYKWETRPITDNDGTTITVSPAFSGAIGAGKEVQVRNSIYDVLPLGWGMGIDSVCFDLASFEDVRDNHLKECNIGEFMLGAEDEIDLWKMLVDNILKPYGILIYFDYNTRKITAGHIGQVSESGTFEDYVAITCDDIVDPGGLDHSFVNPVGTIKLKVRCSNERIVSVAHSTITNDSGTIGYGTAPAATRARIPEMLGGKTQEIIIKSQEAASSFAENELDTISISALFNTIDDFTPLAGRLTGLIDEYSSPPTVWGPGLSYDLYTMLPPGQLVLITWTTPDAPANPFTGARGWSSVVGRVVARQLPLSGGVLSVGVSIELLAAQTVGRVAPACIVSAKGSDGHGAYFESVANTFCADPEADDDMWYFAVGDRLDFRDDTAATKVGWSTRAITGFGSNFVSDPQLASDRRIYVDGAIAPTVNANDYVTFSPWSASNTARMELYSAYANASELLSPSDPAKRYG
jgi:hypothetical protein